MPKSPGRSSGKVKQDTHRPNRTQLYIRMKQQNCLKGIPPGQEYKCDPRFQPPTPPEQRGFREEFYIDRHGQLKMRRRKA